MIFIKLNRFLISILLFSILIIKTSCSDKSYSRRQTIKNFEKKDKEILALADYFVSLRTDSNEIHFEPDGNRYTISIAPPNWAIIPEQPYDAGRNMKLNSVEMDTYLKTLGWSTQTVLTLQEMLIKANCKYISSDGDYIDLHYGTDDVCSFWYIISRRPFADSTIEKDAKLGVTFLRKNVRIGSSCAL